MLLKHIFCIRTTAGYCHRVISESGVIFRGESRRIFTTLPLDCLGVQFKGPFLLFISDSALIHQLVAGNVLLNQTCVLMIQMCQKVPQRTSGVP